MAKQTSKIKISNLSKSVDSTVTANGYTSKTAARVIHDIGNVAQVASIVIPAARGVKLGASAATKIVSKIVENAVAKHGNDAVKVGQQVAKALGEHIKPSIVNAQEAEVTSAKVLKGTPSTTSSTTGSRSVTNSTDSINYVKPGRTQAQADAATRGLSTARQNTINIGSSSATQASTGLLAKGAKTGAKIGGAAGIVAGAAGAEAVDKLVNNLKNKKSGK